MPLPNVDALLNQASFKGMVQTEVAIMKLWLERNAANFDRIEFEVRLGNGGDPAPFMTPELAAQYRYLTQKRADAIAYVGDYPVIIEVKQRLKIRDLGQLLTYRLLYLAEHPETEDARMLAIAYYADSDVRFSLTSHGVDVQLFPEPE